MKKRIWLIFCVAVFLLTAVAPAYGTSPEADSKQAETARSGNTVYRTDTRIANIQSVYECGCEHNYLGAMIGRYGMVLGSGSLYCPEHGGKVKQIGFFFGRTADNQPAVTYNGKFMMKAYETFRDEIKWENNIAYIKFAEPVGDLTGWFKCRVTGNKEMKNRELITRQNVSAQKEPSGLLEETIVVTPEGEKSLAYKQGSYVSGTPALMIGEKEEMLVGLCTYSDSENNYVRRITERVYTDMKKDGVFNNGPVFATPPPQPGSAGTYEAVPDRETSGLSSENAEEDVELPVNTEEQPEEEEAEPEEEPKAGSGAETEDEPGAEEETAEEAEEDPDAEPTEEAENEPVGEMEEESGEEPEQPEKDAEDEPGEEEAEPEEEEPTGEEAPDEKPEEEGKTKAGDSRDGEEAEESADSRIVNLAVQYECGCSMNSHFGTMVGPYGMVVPAAALYCANHGKPYASIQFKFGPKPDGSSFMEYSGEFTHVSYETFENGLNMENAIGYIKFPTAVGEKTGWYKCKAATDTELQAAPLLIKSFQNGYHMVDLKGDARTNGDRIVMVTVDGKVYSGTPAFINKDGEPVLAAILVGKASDGTIFGRRITTKVYKEMKRDGLFQ